MPSIYVLYGSQSGNSKEIILEINSLLEERGISTICSKLNDCLSNSQGVFNFANNEDNLLIIVCSTHGNGDAPETANHFWRKLKDRKLSHNFLSNCKYAVLGLGDTNYDKFCQMGKNIDRRLSELGAETVIELHCADEAVGLEDVVEVFKKKIMEYIDNLLI